MGISRKGLAILAGILWTSAQAWADPVTIDVQGRLTSVAGGAVADGGYAMAIALYDGEAAKKPLYYESFLAVSVTGGVFAAAIGAGNVGLDSALFAPGKAGWLGVTVGGDPELPRVPLRPTPTSIHANLADLANNLACSACVGPGELAAAVVGSDQLQAGAVLPVHVAFAYAASDSKGGEALQAKVADSLQCTGCITAAMLAPSVPGDLGLVKANALANVAFTGNYGDLQGNPDLGVFAKSANLAAVASSGKYSDLVGGPDLSPYAKLSDANAWQKTQTLGADTDFGLHQALNFRLQVAAVAPAKCAAATVGLVYYDSKLNQILVCNGTDFKAIASNLSTVGSQSNPGKSCKDVLTAGSLASGQYWLTQGGVTFTAYCDMVTAGGGWTLALNLDTSDGHVMWWGNSLWTDANLFGKGQLTGGDFKGDPWNTFSTATKVLVVVHQNGVIKGWKSFTRPNKNTLFQSFQAGDNTVLGNGVIASDITNVWAGERVVRISTQLFANHCVSSGGGCVAGNSGSPDGDRIGSDEATPSDNNGGGLGNWHDMNYCCAGQNYAGKACNGSAFRTTSEAQANWSACYGSNPAGYFGSDTFAPGTNACNDSNCGNANYAAPSGQDYDYAIFLSED